MNAAICYKYEVISALGPNGGLSTGWLSSCLPPDGMKKLAISSATIA